MSPILASAQGYVTVEVSEETWDGFNLAVLEETYRGLLFRFAFSEEMGLG